MTSLRESRENDTLAEFAAKREADTPPGDEARFNRALASMAGTLKEAPAASSRRLKRY